MYYILESELHTMVGMITYPNPGWGLHFTKGVSLDSDFGEGQIFVEFEKDHDALPDYFELSKTPIVSEKFVQQLKTLPLDNYQLFPVVVKMPAGQVMGYYILNVVGRVSAVDKAASDCKMYEDDIMRLNKLVLREDLNQDLDMFRADEFPLAVFISERVKEALEAGSLSGMLIKPADGWNDKHRF